MSFFAWIRLDLAGYSFIWLVGVQAKFLNEGTFATPLPRQCSAVGQSTGGSVCARRDVPIHPGG